MTEKTVMITFIEQKTGKTKTINARVGDTLLEVAREHDLAMEGACEGSLACSTCHVKLEEGVFKLLEPPLSEEEDMLDFAFAVCPLSRLGCQVRVTEEMNSTTIEIPSETRNWD